MMRRPQNPFRALSVPAAPLPVPALSLVGFMFILSFSGSQADTASSSPGCDKALNPSCSLESAGSFRKVPTAGAQPRCADCSPWGIGHF